MNNIIQEIIGLLVFLVVLFAIGRLYWAKFQMKHNFRAESLNGRWTFNAPHQVDTKPKVKVIETTDKD